MAARRPVCLLSVASLDSLEGVKVSDKVDLRTGESKLVEHNLGKLHPFDDLVCSFSWQSCTERTNLNFVGSKDMLMQLLSILRCTSPRALIQECLVASRSPPISMRYLECLVSLKSR